MEELCSVTKASALLVYCLASPMKSYLFGGIVSSLYTVRTGAIPELPEGKSKASTCRTFVLGWARASE